MSPKLKIAYELSMATLAMAVVVVLIVEFTLPLNERQETVLAAIDFSILSVFAIDYFVRLFKAQNKWAFIKSNIFDLIAIMPFDKAFRIARLARLTRLARLSRAARVTKFLRLTKLLRAGLFIRRFWCIFSGVLQTNGLYYVVAATVLIIITGAFSIMALEPAMDNFEDALWWSLVTATTVGYGDISPETSGGRVLAAALMLVGIVFLGMVTGSIATYFVQRLSGKADEDTSFHGQQLKLIRENLGNLEKMTYEDVSSLNKAILSLWLAKSQGVGVERDQNRLIEGG